MRRLFWRIFVTFWIAMVLIVAGVASAVYWVVSDLRADSPRVFQTQPLAVEAQEVVSEGGVDGLRVWLERQSRDRNRPKVFVFNAERQEILGRSPVPPHLRLHHPPGIPEPAEPGNVGVRRAFTISGPDGEQYWMVVAPNVTRIGRWFLPFGPGRIQLAGLLIAIVVTAATCLLLARYLSAPIDKLRHATRAVADGNLGVRVGPSLGARNDELGLLAGDFDYMSERLRVLLDGRQQLMRDLSHELRSPLARLQVALGLARRPDAQVVPQLDRIEREAGRLDALVGQILLLSQLDDPSAAVKREGLDVSELLETLVEDSRLEVANRNITVDWRKDGTDTAQVRADRQLLGSAIENVLRNAIHYSPDGGKIDVELLTYYGQVRITVMDRGPGVPPEELGSIFEPFYRARTQGDRSARGHGLGLAITNRIMNLHYGSVQARNRDGGGLTVELRIPHV